MARNSLFLPASLLEVVLTVIEIALAAWLYSLGYSGAAGLLAGGTLASFLSRRMAPYHMAKHTSRLIRARLNEQSDTLFR
jgi:hypothetical protein